ncbi:Putative peptidoglycan binding domain-containing protein [Loktanella fryxellensis]|uniref:Putative peptidoglycan binding domain-containing protein n=1 Tax=Loktanella fryxellensis TaxID=245187 RepID=A0A1H8EP44_9RHOB|nr:peptidoglycan-binding domain-containing protein [Loktanella fryxellensis]SEN20647.1 Putative peptidoglycan binding domain-containing protein [Loktanella fryxellensis]
MHAPSQLCRLGQTAAMVLLTACGAAQGPDAQSAPIVIAMGEIETDAAGRCFAMTAPQTQTNIVEDTVEVVPAQRAADGTVTQAAVLRRVSRPQTVAVGPGARFETLCPPAYTVAFVQTLQRALLIRRSYAGPITGQYDTATREAVAAFQRNRDIDSSLLSVDVARDLGITAVPRT